jgi:hypothetical protein
MSVIDRIIARRVRRQQRPFSPASDPPKAAETMPVVTPWAEWDDKIKTHLTPPGWTFCKFGVRAGETGSAAEVWGIVRDGYGTYWCRFFVNIIDDGQHGENFLAVAVNTRNGYAIGIFASMVEACEAIEIALRLSRRGELDHDPDGPEAREAYLLLGRALGAAGYGHGHIICRPMQGSEPVPGPPRCALAHDADRHQEGWPAGKVRQPRPAQGRDAAHGRGRQDRKADCRGVGPQDAARDRALHRSRRPASAGARRHREQSAHRVA